MEFVNIYIFWTIRVIFQAGNSMIAVECEPVPTKVLNPNASEASYKPEQRIDRKTKLKKISLFGYESSICLGLNCPSPETSRRRKKQINPPGCFVPKQIDDSYPNKQIVQE